jgi:hypothetical protein
MSIRGRLEEILGEDAVAGGKASELPNVFGTGEAESSTAGIRKIIEEEGARKLDNLADDLKEAENADARGSGAKPEEAEQKTLSAGSELSGEFTDWAQAADDVIGTLP